jgi:hypothetical protein
MDHVMTSGGIKCSTGDIRRRLSRTIEGQHLPRSFGLCKHVGLGCSIKDKRRVAEPCVVIIIKSMVVMINYYYHRVVVTIMVFVNNIAFYGTDQQKTLY